MTTTTKADAFEIDPRMFQGERDSPFLLNGSREERVLLTAYVIADLRKHPQNERHPISGVRLVNEDQVWHRIRFLPVREDGLTVEQLFKRHGTVAYQELRWLITALMIACDKRADLLALAATLEPVALALGGQVGDVTRTTRTAVAAQ